MPRRIDAIAPSELSSSQSFAALPNETLDYITQCSDLPEQLALAHVDARCRAAVSRYLRLEPPIGPQTRGLSDNPALQPLLDPRIGSPEGRRLLAFSWNALAGDPKICDLKLVLRPAATDPRGGEKNPVHLAFAAGASARTLAQVLDLYTETSESVFRRPHAPQPAPIYRTSWQHRVQPEGPGISSWDLQESVHSSYRDALIEPVVRIGTFAQLKALAPLAMAIAPWHFCALTLYHRRDPELLLHRLLPDFKSRLTALHRTWPGQSEMRATCLMLFASHGSHPGAALRTVKDAMIPVCAPWRRNFIRVDEIWMHLLANPLTTAADLIAALQVWDTSARWARILVVIAKLQSLGVQTPQWQQRATTAVEHILLHAKDDRALAALMVPGVARACYQSPNDATAEEAHVGGIVRAISGLRELTTNHPSCQMRLRSARLLGNFIESVTLNSSFNLADVVPFADQIGYVVPSDRSPGEADEVLYAIYKRCPKHFEHANRTGGSSAPLTLSESDRKDVDDRRYEQTFTYVEMAAWLRNLWSGSEPGLAAWMGQRLLGRARNRDEALLRKKFLQLAGYPLPEETLRQRYWI